MFVARSPLSFGWLMEPSTLQCNLVDRNSIKCRAWDSGSTTMNIPCIMCREIVGIMEYANLATSGWLNLFTSGGLVCSGSTRTELQRERERERGFWRTFVHPNWRSFKLGPDVIRNLVLMGFFTPSVLCDHNVVVSGSLWSLWHWLWWFPCCCNSSSCSCSSLQTLVD